MPERAHTPITSEAQRGLFGAEIARKKEGKKGRTGMSEETLAEHLHESAGKDLPAKKVEKGKANIFGAGKAAYDTNLQHRREDIENKKLFPEDYSAPKQKPLTDRINNFVDKAFKPDYNRIWGGKGQEVQSEEENEKWHRENDYPDESKPPVKKGGPGSGRREDPYRRRWIGGGHSTTASASRGKGSSVERNTENQEAINRLPKTERPMQEPEDTGYTNWDKFTGPSGRDKEADKAVKRQQWERQQAMGAKSLTKAIDEFIEKETYASETDARLTQLKRKLESQGIKVSDEELKNKAKSVGIIKMEESKYKRLSDKFGTSSVKLPGGNMEKPEAKKVVKSISDFLEKEDKSPVICNECGHKFKRAIGKNTTEIKCSKCGGVDTELD